MTIPPEYDAHSVQPSSDRSPGLWLGLSIASTVLCCLPLGVVGIVYAALAMGAQARGDQSTAQWHTDRARGWTMGSIIVGLLVGVAAACMALQGGSDGSV